METPRRKHLLVKLLQPKVGVPLIIGLSILSAILAYRNSRLNGLPDIGTPFDVEKSGTIEITDDENAFVEYNQATPTKDPSDVDDVIRQGWSTATPGHSQVARR